MSRPSAAAPDQAGPSPASDQIRLNPSKSHQIRSHQTGQPVAAPPRSEKRTKPRRVSVFSVSSVTSCKIRGSGRGPGDAALAADRTQSNQIKVNQGKAYPGVRPTPRSQPTTGWVGRSRLGPIKPGARRHRSRETPHPIKPNQGKSRRPKPRRYIRPPPRPPSATGRVGRSRPARRIRPNPSKSPRVSGERRYEEL